MEGIALDLAAIDRGVEKAVVEGGVMAHQDGSGTAVCLDRLAHRTKYLAKRLGLADRHLLAQRVIEADAGEIQRCLLHIGTGKGFDVVGEGGVGQQVAFRVHGQGDGGDLQQGVGFRVEAAGLDIHHHRQKTAKTLRHEFAGDQLAHAPLLSRAVWGQGACCWQAETAKV